MQSYTFVTVQACSLPVLPLSIRPVQDGQVRPPAFSAEGITESSKLAGASLSSLQLSSESSLQQPCALQYIDIGYVCVPAFQATVDSEIEGVSDTKAQATWISQLTRPAPRHNLLLGGPNS